MRIVQLYHDFRQRGGAERHVETLTSSLIELGHEVTIVSQTPPPGFRAFQTNFSRCSIPVSVIRLSRWIRHERIHLLHAHSRITALVAFLASRLYRIPLVVTCHILPVGLHRLSQWGDATICVSEAARQHLITHYKLAPSNLTVIHNGVQTGVAPNAQLYFGPPPVISFVARFALGKGHEMFLNVARSLIASGFPGTFVLAGNGPLEPKLRSRYASDRILFLGHRKDVSSILASSSASVVCSESEAFSYVVVESLAVGTAVISTDCGGTAEIIQHGRNGFLFPVGDAESLRRWLLAISNQASEPTSGMATRHEIAEECRVAFSLGAMVKATMGVYQKCDGLAPTIV